MRRNVSNVGRNSRVTKVPTLGSATKHPGFTHQGGNDSRATEEHFKDVDRSNGRETNKTKRNFNDNEEHGLASGETVNNSQEERGRHDEKQKEDVLVQNDFAQVGARFYFKRGRFVPWQNMVLQLKFIDKVNFTFNNILRIFKVS